MAQLTKTLQVRITPDLMQTIKTEAKCQNVRASEIVRQILVKVFVGNGKESNGNAHSDSKTHMQHERSQA